MDATITYSPLVSGFPSFYSYNPDFMLGCNSHFYTFKDGNLFRHNTNERRNNFYGEDYPSIITTVFNEDILNNKVYKTIGLQGDSVWDVEIETDLMPGGYIEADWFDEKEEVWFGFIRTPQEIPADTADYVLRSVNGIARSSAVTGVTAATHVEFQISPTPVSIGSILSVGDSLYYALPPYTTPIFCGTVTAIVQNYPAGNNYIQVNCTVGNVPPIQTAYFMFVKNQIAESQGVIGHYAVITLENNETTKQELFAVQAEVMRSFP